MRNFFILFLSLVFIVLKTSCSQRKSEETPDIYLEKSINLINDVLSDENNICDCLLLPLNKPTLQEFEDDVPHFNYEEYLLKTFGLSKKSDLNKLHGFNEELILKPNSLNSNVKIIYRKDWDSIFSKYGFDARDTIFKRYPNLCYLTKPIFDKEYKTAIMDMDFGGCLWFPPSRLQFINGKWEYD